MVKALVNLTARILSTHREMTPLISRIHSGFMVERSLQAVEADIQKIQDMIHEVRQALKSPIKTDSRDYTLLK
jgi:hypothetical protein